MAGRDSAAESGRAVAVRAQAAAAGYRSLTFAAIFALSCSSSEQLEHELQQTNTAWRSGD